MPWVLYFLLYVRSCDALHSDKLLRCRLVAVAGWLHMVDELRTLRKSTMLCSCVRFPGNHNGLLKSIGSYIAI